MSEHENREDVFFHQSRYMNTTFQYYLYAALNACDVLTSYSPAFDRAGPHCKTGYIPLHTFGIAAFHISFPESGRDKTGAGGMGYTIFHNSAGKQADDSAKIYSGIVDFKIGDIAAPYLIGPICSKMPLQ